eukprot:SAG22_NODE_2417_length_2597_cov_3.155324_1_plen_245_part_00
MPSAHVRPTAPAQRRLAALSAAVAPDSAAGASASDVDSAAVTATAVPLGRFADPEDWSSPTHASHPEPTSGCELVCGTNNFGTRITDVAAALEALAALGIGEIDTARAYNGGQSEDALGLALSQTEASADFIVGSKVTWMKLGYERVQADLAASLAALKKQKLDVYYLHAPDQAASLVGTLRAVHEAHQAGLFSEFGVSNFRPWQLVQIFHIMKGNSWGPLPTVYQVTPARSTRLAGSYCTTTS